MSGKKNGKGQKWYEKMNGYKCEASAFIGDNWSKIFIAWGASMPSTIFRILIDIGGNWIKRLNLILFINITLEDVPISYATKYIPVTQLE